RRDLCAARIELKSEEVVAEHSVDGLCDRELLFFSAQRDHHWQSEREEVAAPHTGVQHPEVFRRRWPLGERARGGPPDVALTNEAQVAPLDAGRRARRAALVLRRRRAREVRLGREDLARPPRAERVVEQ